MILEKIVPRLNADFENPKPSPGAAHVRSRGHSTSQARHIEDVLRLVDQLRTDGPPGRLRTRHLEGLHSVVSSGNP